MPKDEIDWNQYTLGKSSEITPASIVLEGDHDGAHLSQIEFNVEAFLLHTLRVVVRQPDVRPRFSIEISGRRYGGWTVAALQDHITVDPRLFLHGPAYLIVECGEPVTFWVSLDAQQLRNL